jgi:ATP-dependent Clp protease ATP-binding subunit ClpA
LHPAGEPSEGSGEMELTVQGKQSIQLATQEAQFLGHNYIDTEHLLLGLPRQEESLAN